MFGYGGYGKRSRDIMHCGECGDPFDAEEDEWNVCGECERALCSECMSTCDLCENSDGQYAESIFICEGCMNFCRDCDSGRCFHKECFVEHLKTCNKKTRAQRALASVKEERKQTERKLRDARNRLATLQRNVESYEKELARLKEQEAKAEKALKEEEGEEEDSKKPAAK